MCIACELSAFLNDAACIRVESSVPRFRMPRWFLELSPVTQALLGTLFSWGMTAAGAALVLFTSKENRKLLDIMLGVHRGGHAGGELLVVCWRLPSRCRREWRVPSWFPAAARLLARVRCFLRGADLLLPHVHPRMKTEDAEGIETPWRRTTLLVVAITLHNIPEGLAVGVAFGAAAHGLDSASVAGAVALALGIGIQNFPGGSGGVDAPATRRDV